MTMLAGEKQVPDSYYCARETVALINMCTFVAAIPRVAPQFLAVVALAQILKCSFKRTPL